MKTWQRNVLVAPITILIRAPLIGICIVLIRVGEYAEKFAFWVQDHLPGFYKGNE